MGSFPGFQVAKGDKAFGNILVVEGFRTSGK